MQSEDIGNTAMSGKSAFSYLSGFLVLTSSSGHLSWWDPDACRTGFRDGQCAPSACSHPRSGYQGRVSILQHVSMLWVSGVASGQQDQGRPLGLRVSAYLFMTSSLWSHG